MADIFNTGISDAKDIQQNIGEPGFAPPSRAAGVEINPEDIYNLRASTRQQQLQEQEKQVQLSRQADQARLNATKHLDDLTKGFINRYKEIDTKVTNPIERNRLKRDTYLSALQAGGKENYAYINTIAAQLETKRTARNDGMIEITGKNGELLGVEAGSVDQILKSNLDRDTQTIETVFPDVLDGLTGLLQIDAETGNHIKDTTVSEFINTMKKQSQNLEHISDEYHIMANQLPSSELPKLTAKAQAGYMNGVSDIFSIYTSTDMLKAIKKGDGISRSDLEANMQQIRRNFVDEITSQKIPVSIQDIDAFIQTTMNNIGAAYDSAAKNDLVSLQVEKDALTLKNEIAKQHARTRLGAPEIEAAQPMIDHLSKAAATSANLTQSAQGMQISGDEKGANALLDVARGMTSLIEGGMSNFEKYQQHTYQSSFNMSDYIDGVKNATDRAGALKALGALSKITKHEAGWTLAPYVAGAVDLTTAKLEELVRDGALGEDEVDAMLSQLGQYQTRARSFMRKMGTTEQQFIEQSEQSVDWFKNIGDFFGFNKPSTKDITPLKKKVSRETAQRGD